MTYAYEVKARWKEDGKVVERLRQIVAHAGDSLRVDLGPQDRADLGSAGPALRQTGK